MYLYSSVLVPRLYITMTVNGAYAAVNHKVTVVNGEKRAESRVFDRFRHNQIRAVIQSIRNGRNTIKNGCLRPGFFDLGYTDIVFSSERASIAYIRGSTYSTNSKYSIRLLKPTAPEQKHSDSILKYVHVYVGELIREFVSPLWSRAALRDVTILFFSFSSYSCMLSYVRFLLLLLFPFFLRFLHFFFFYRYDAHFVVLRGPRALKPHLL
jgi:hypothetical protein